MKFFENKYTKAAEKYFKVQSSEHMSVISNVQEYEIGKPFEIDLPFV